MRLDLALQTRGGMNAREHHMARSRRVKSERATVGWYLRAFTKPALPLIVTLTRIAPSAGLDDDNLASALKSCRDSFAEWIGVDDRHRDVVRYRYEQERGAWGVRIEADPA
jgi:hypothetical protein